MLCVDDFDESDEPPEPDLISHDEDDNNTMVFDDSNGGEEFAEYDPSGRYGRYDEVLGKGAMKTVYRAYDSVDCKEVAWSKARPPVECSEEQAIAVWREIRLLQGIEHSGILKLYYAWDDEATGHTNFITELCSSTLLEHRMKHKHLSRKAVKCWGRQILKGLAHLHMQDPPIIHRDLKCENIFVKCSSDTALKLGDFGSATCLDETHHMHTMVGTPEFMAPEMFEEDYDELVDVYSFGMCMLELLTCECPYSECKSLAQIYKKVTHGEKPKALLKVKDVEAFKLINRCLLPASERPSACELLSDPFLQCHEANSNGGRSIRSSIPMPKIRVPNLKYSCENVGRLAKPCRKKSDNSVEFDSWGASTDCMRKQAICTKSPSFRRSYSVMGRVEDQYTLRLKIRIQESSRSCDIDFPFDLRYDSPRSVAEEMVRALDYPESDFVTIAELISKEIAELAPSFEESSSKVPALEGLSQKHYEDAKCNRICDGDNAGKIAAQCNKEPSDLAAAGRLPSNVSSIVFSKSLANGRISNTAYIKIKIQVDEKCLNDLALSDNTPIKDINQSSNGDREKGSTKLANHEVSRIVNTPSLIFATCFNSGGGIDVYMMKVCVLHIQTCGAAAKCLMAQKEEVPAAAAIWDRYSFVVLMGVQPPKWALFSYKYFCMTLSF